jgi:hypothetical protein
MISVGIDDTDILGARGTNQLAREIARRAAVRWSCRQIVRHQLLHDPRIPFTSKNGSASLMFESVNGAGLPELIDLCRDTMRDWFIPGSDPGLCVTERVPPEVVAYGELCQREIVTQETARNLARRTAIHLEGLGGTEGGVIGALAAVGLAATGNDGRIVQWGSWPDDLTGRQPIAALNERGVLVLTDDGVELTDGEVDVGKHLRPNVRGHRAVLFVERMSDERYGALKLT